MPNPAYPTLAIDPKESKRTLRDGREEDPAGDGVARVRKLYADKYDFDIKHPALNPTDIAILEAFYATYGMEPIIDLTWPENGVVYPVRFGKQALRTQLASKTTLARHAWTRLVAAG